MLIRPTLFRSLIVGFAALSLGAPAMLAQNVSKVDLFGGFSLLNADSASGSGRDSVYGWQGSATWNVKPHVGLVADFGGQYKSYDVPYQGTTLSLNTSNYDYLFGPQFAMRSGNIAVFAHVLAGGLRQTAAVPVSSLFTSSASVNVSSNGFLVGLGGGLDINVGRHAAIRVIQFDWLPERGNDPYSGQSVWSTDAIRLGFGVVFRAGSGR
jgi:hypothetical protein